MFVLCQDLLNVDCREGFAEASFGVSRLLFVDGGGHHAFD
jgi:hypothetical protein